MALCALIGSTLACSRTADAPRPRHVLLITIDTLRADRVGAYGYARAQTPRLDALARSGALFTHAYAAAPITLPSHATILSGRYPPHHGARDNGIRMSASTPTLATVLAAQGFRTGAFVAAFPLDHQFGLERGFSVYSDRLPRDSMGRQANERPASAVVSEAIDWLEHRASGSEHREPGTEHRAPDTEHRAPGTEHPTPSTQHPAPFFLWIHCFEPHAPYEGDPSRPVAERYDQEIATVDREIGRLLDALGPALADTLVVVTGDHGEAFGEHGEYAHSLFVYDTTLRVPLIISGPGIAPRHVDDPVTLADLAPTIVRRLGLSLPDADGIDLSPALAGQPLAVRELYAESFAPLVEFGWAPLRSVRSGAWKYTAAPKPELFDLAHDAAEQQNVVAAHADVAQSLDGRVNRFSGDSLSGAPGTSGEAAARLRALGYLSGSAASNAKARSDPKDRRELGARIAQVTSGELTGDALIAALEGIVRDDPGNGQARLRLGYARVQAGDCGRAVPEFEAALTAGLRTADVYLGLAGCFGQRRDLAGAERALNEARRLEPDNPVVVANIGILKASKGDEAGAIETLQSALAADPNLHEARFNLALTYARLGRRTEGAAAARELLVRLPPNAPQRPEVERLLKAIEAR